jgi:Cu2+-exporting ATPase
MILVPNIVCVAGVFTLGFGIGASVVANNVAAIGALVNGVWPMREVAKLEAERRHALELEILAATEQPPSRDEPSESPGCFQETVHLSAAEDLKADGSPIEVSRSTNRRSTVHDETKAGRRKGSKI